MYAENAFSDYRFMLFCKSACGHLTVEEFCDKIIEHRVWCCWEDVEYISYWEFMKGRPGLSVKPLNRVSLCNERYIEGEMEITCVQTEQDYEEMKRAHNFKRTEDWWSALAYKLINRHSKRVLETVGTAYFVANKDTIVMSLPR